MASAMNVNVAAYDGVGIHTASLVPVSQSWARVFESGFGENSTPPGLFTAVPGSDTAIGGTPAGANVYYAEVGSDGTFSGQIRAGSAQAGVGFIEFTTYVSIPINATMALWGFALSISYEWTS